GLGMFLFERVWGALADRVGYRLPLVLSQVLYAGGIVLLASSRSVPLIAVAYLLASGMMVAAGPLGRSFLGTTLPPRLRATGLAFIASQWIVAGAIGSGVGGQLIEHFPIRNVLYGASVLPLIAALLLLLVFMGYKETRGIWSRGEQPAPARAQPGESFMRGPAVTAWISESAPHRRHALAMGIFGEFENLGVTLGPVAGGLAWSAAGIQAAFFTYAVTAVLVAVVSAIAVSGRVRAPGPVGAI